MVDGSALTSTSRVSSAMVIFLFSLGRFRGGFESIEAPGPVLVEEGAKSCHFIDVGAVEAARTGAAFTYQIRLSQYSQMLGDRRTRDVVEVLRNVSGGQFRRPDQSKYLSTLRIGDGFQGNVHRTSVSERLRKMQLNYGRIFYATQSGEASLDSRA